MEAKRFAKEAPCSAVAVNAFVHLGMAGLAWGVVSGPYRADKRGSLGGAFHAIRCGVRRYRMQEDWVNSGIAGAIAGAALGMKTRSLTQIAITSVIVSGIVTVIDSSKPF